MQLYQPIFFLFFTSLLLPRLWAPTITGPAANYKRQAQQQKEDLVKAGVFHANYFA